VPGGAVAFAVVNFFFENGSSVHGVIIHVREATDPTDHFLGFTCLGLGFGHEISRSVSVWFNV
jgi:hypothetical protein